MNNFLDGNLSIDEEAKLNNFLNYYNNDNGTINVLGMQVALGDEYLRIFKTKFLQEIMDGKLPESPNKIIGEFPFILQKDEVIVWVENVADHYDQTKATTRIAGMSGMSVKMAKGLYYRTGTAKGETRTVISHKFMGNGILVFTNKNMYFYSSKESFKIPYNKIVATQTGRLVNYTSEIENCIIVQKSGVTATGQIFAGFDEWFVLNLIENMINFNKEETENKEIKKSLRKTKSVANELIKLKKLMDEGILTEEEFDEQKKSILCQDQK